MGEQARIWGEMSDVVDGELTSMDELSQGIDWERLDKVCAMVLEETDSRYISLGRLTGCL